MKAIEFQSPLEMKICDVCFIITNERNTAKTNAQIGLHMISFMLINKLIECISISSGDHLLGSLSKDVFERRMSTGSEAFSLFICLDANKLVLLSFVSLLKTIYPRVLTKPLPNDAKSPLQVDVRRLKTLLLKLPIIL